jgi:hypothetical protein
MRLFARSLSAVALCALGACAASETPTGTSAPQGGPPGASTAPSASDPSAPKAKPGSVDTSFGKDGLVLVGPTWEKVGSNHILLAREDGTASVYESGQYLTDVTGPLARYDIDATGKAAKAVPLAVGGDVAGTLLPRPAGGYLLTSMNGCLFLTDKGALDPSVGDNGFVALDGLGQHAVRDDQGRVYADYKSSIARITPACALDTSWGKAGSSSDTPGTMEAGYVVERDGSIFGVTGTNLSSVLYRFRPDGTADTSFGTAGQLVDSGSSHSTGIGVALDSQGRVLVGTMSSELGAGGAATSSTFAFQRFVAGKRDASFAPAPMKLAGPWTIGSKWTVGNFATEGGRIYAIGYRGSSLGAKEAVVMAFTEAGEPATDFGDNGVVTVQVPSDVAAGGEFRSFSIALNPPGKLTVLIDAVTSYFRSDGVNGTGGGFAVLRLNR